jgi:hypothetical protein
VNIIQKIRPFLAALSHRFWSYLYYHLQQIKIDNLDFVNDNHRTKYNAIAEENEKRIVKRDSENKYNVYKVKYSEYQIKYQTMSKMMDLVSTILPNFEHHLLKKTQDEIIDKLYQLPNKLLKWRFKEIDNEFDKIVNLLFYHLNKTTNVNTIKKDELNNMLSAIFIDLIRAIILSTYDKVARISMDVSTENKICKKTIKNQSHLIQKIMFKSFSCADDDYFSFKEDFVKTYNSRNVKNSQLLQSCMKLIARRFLIDNKIDIANAQGTNQKFLSTVYGRDYKNNLLVDKLK